MSVQPQDDLRERSMFDTDIPTLDNFYTGFVPDTDQYPTGYRLRDDGPVDPSRRYAPDDALAYANVLSMETLPASFGEYADGLIVMYTSSEIGRTKLAPHGWNDGEYVANEYWTIPKAVLRFAVHAKATKASEYALGWVPLSFEHVVAQGYPVYDVGSPEPTEADRGTYNAIWQPKQLFPDNDQTVPYFGTGATIVSGLYYAPDDETSLGARMFAQNLGEYVFAFFDSNADPYVTGSQGGTGGSIANDLGVFRINPDLTVESLGIRRLALSSDYQNLHINDDADPLVTFEAASVVFQARLSELVSGQTLVETPVVESDYAGTHLITPLGQLNGAGTIGASYHQVTSGPLETDILYQGGVHIWAEPWRTGDYGAPELWVFRPVSDLNGDTGFEITAAEYGPGNLTKPGTKAVLTVSGEGTYDPSNGFSRYAQLPYYLLDDDDYTAGKTAFPSANPLGYGYRERGVAGQIPAIPGSAGLDGSFSLRVIRDRAHTGVLHLLVHHVCQPPRGETPVPGLSVPVGSDFAYSNYSPRSTTSFAYKGIGTSINTVTSNVWTSTSYDDGETWATPSRVIMPVTLRTDSLDGIKKAGGIALMQINSLFRSTVLTAENTLLTAVAEIRTYKFMDGSRVPFFTESPGDAGTRIALYAPNFEDYSGVAAPGSASVVFKKAE